jgi:hypothetical protein
MIDESTTAGPRRRTCRTVNLIISMSFGNRAEEEINQQVERMDNEVRNDRLVQQQEEQEHSR